MSDYVGRITKDEIIEKGKDARPICGYGNSALVYSMFGGLIARLQKYFPDMWTDLYALSMVRLMDPVPLKSVKDRCDEKIDDLLGTSILPKKLRS